MIMLEDYKDNVYKSLTALNEPHSALDLGAREIFVILSSFRPPMRILVSVQQSCFAQHVVEQQQAP
jgi:hypothetical protein